MPAAIVKEKKPVQKKDKFLLFELYPSDLSCVPEDEKGIKRQPYPILKTVANSGNAINRKTGEIEEWRYVYAFQKSIWRSEQPTLLPAQLNDPRNDLTFRRGRLMVREIETAKIAALKIQDGFKECLDPINPDKQKEYFLVSQEANDAAVLGSLNDAFEAEKRAREMTPEDMYAMASLFAIDLDLTDISIRTQLILKSKEHPTVFLREIDNPATKVKFMFLRALQENVITVRNGRVIMTDTDTAQCDIRENVDASDELTKMWKNGDKNVKKLADLLSNLVNV